MSTTVPPEIIDHIFSFLKSDPTTLARCSRTHSVLSPFAERLLYADIVVNDNEVSLADKDDCRSFLASELHKLLIDFPHISNYIHKLEIRLSCAADGIAPILPMLLRLSSISLTPSSSRVWTDLPTEFCDAFANCLSSRSVWKEVSISFVGFPLRLFDNCKTVKRITLYGYADLNENRLQPVPFLVLESLYLRHWMKMSKFLDWTRKHIYGLRSLVFDSFHINGVLPGLIGVYSNTLTSLELNINRKFRTVFYADGRIRILGRRISLDLSSVPHLKNLTIHTNMYIHITTEYRSALPAILALLETTLRLDNLTLVFYINTSDFNLIDWSRLFTFLSLSSDKFLHIRLHLVRTRNEHVVPSVDTLPRLCHSEIVSDMIAKGILDITVGTGMGDISL